MMAAKSASPDNCPLPLPLDEAQAAHMERAAAEGFVIAIPDCERFEQLVHLADRGFLISRVCPNAMGVHQFEITESGRIAIEEHQRDA